MLYNIPNKNSEKMCFITYFLIYVKYDVIKRWFLAGNETFL